MSYQKALENLNAMISLRDSWRYNLNLDQFYSNVLFEVKEEKDSSLLILLIPSLFKINNLCEDEKRFEIFNIILDKVNKEEESISMKLNREILDSIYFCEVLIRLPELKSFADKNEKFISSLSRLDLLYFYMNYYFVCNNDDLDAFFEKYSDNILEVFGNEFFQVSIGNLIDFHNGKKWTFWASLISYENINIDKFISFDNFNDNAKYSLEPIQYAKIIEFVFELKNKKTFKFFINLIDKGLFCLEIDSGVQLKEISLLNPNVRTLFSDKIEILKNMKSRFHNNLNIVDYFNILAPFNSTINRDIRFQTPLELKDEDVRALTTNCHDIPSVLSVINESVVNCFDEKGFLLDDFKNKHHFKCDKENSLLGLIKTLDFYYDHSYYYDHSERNNRELKVSKLSELIIESFNNISLDAEKSFSMLSFIEGSYRMVSSHSCYVNIIESLSDDDCFAYLESILIDCKPDFHYLVKELDTFNFTAIMIIKIKPSF